VRSFPRGTGHRARRRGRRIASERAQVSAVATILGLLLVVSFISTYALGPLPAQEAQNEYQHLLVVEDQLARLEASLQAQAVSVDPQLLMVSPLTLGSAAVPPFGPPARGDLAFSPNGTSVVYNNEIGPSIYHAPNWGNGTLCFGHGGTGCSNSGSYQCNPPLSDNYSASNTTFSYSLSGHNDCLFLNLTGNHDVLNIRMSGASWQFAVVTIYGNNDFVNLRYTSSGTLFNVWLYGAYDTFNYTTTGRNNIVNTYLIGEGNPAALCPYGNVSNTDTVAYSLGGNGNLANSTWYNLVGYITPYRTVGSGGNTYGFQNVSGQQGCAWYSTVLTSYPVLTSGGLSITLENSYTAPALLGLEDGGVFLGSSNGQSVMVDPPPMRFYTTSQGAAFSITLFAFSGRAVYEQGYATAGVGTRVLSVVTYNLTIGSIHNQVVSEPYLNLTTRFPLAWYNYFHSAPSRDFLGPVTCTTLPALQPRCLTPPPGVSVQLSVPLNVATYTVSYVSVAVSFT
jgi:hypothetical protein